VSREYYKSSGEDWRDAAFAYPAQEFETAMPQYALSRCHNVFLPTHRAPLQKFYLDLESLTFSFEINRAIRCIALGRELFLRVGVRDRGRLRKLHALAISQ
jgi:hypothetical protein